MHRKALTLAVCLFLFASAREAAAQVGQPWIDRGYFNFNIGFESTSGTLSDATTFQLTGDPETGTLSVQSGVDSGALIDLSVGDRVWKNVSVGIGYHRGSTSGDGTLEASVPHPLIFNQHRNVALAVTELDRTEQAFHFTVGYMVQIEDLNVHLTLGPSYFRLKQEVVSEVVFTEVGPPFTSVNAAPTITERTDSAWGFNIGVDGAYKVYETPDVRVGVGVFVRYAGASAKIQIIGTEVDSDVGGVQIGFGARFRF